MDVSNTKVALVGAGNVATALALALKADGQQVVQVWSRTEPSAAALAQQVGAAHTSSLSELCPDADVYVLSVADAAVRAAKAGAGLAARGVVAAAKAGGKLIKRKRESR